MQFLCGKKMLLLICLVFSILYAAIVTAAETIQLITQKDLPNNLGVYRHLQIELEQPKGAVHLHVTTLNNNYQASFYQQTEERQALAKFLDQLSQQEDFHVAINGGFYTHAFKAAGLFKLQGNMLRPLARDRLLASCIGTDKNQKLLLGETRDSCMQQFSAMQTGPLLINHGKVNENLVLLEQNMPKSKAFFMDRRRTIIAKSNDDKILAIVTSAVRLTDIAYILQKYATAMGIKETVMAIDLDGGSSTGMYIRFAEQPFYYPELKHVKTMVFFN
ncbi:hypothetical protein BH10PSE19_BH10PSE19_02390 [soil metagenome]